MDSIERGRIGGSVRQVRATGRWFLRQLERIEKTGGYPTDEQVRTAVTTAEFLLQSKSERAQGLGAAIILKAREGATKRGMAVLKLSEEARQHAAGQQIHQTSDVRILIADARGHERIGNADDIRALMAPPETPRETVGMLPVQGQEPGGDGGATGREDAARGG